MLSLMRVLMSIVGDGLLMSSAVPLESRGVEDGVYD